MKKFEIPYNFDDNLIDILKVLDREGETIHSIYLEPFRPDYRSAKYYHDGVYNNRPVQRADYESHVRYIQSAFPNKVMLLLQQNNICMDDDVLDYYVNNLKITKYCVGSLEQAKKIKEIDNTIEVIGSITMKAEVSEFYDEEYRKYFNAFVLFFPYNRDLDLIKKLPRWFDYILLVNCACNIHCDGTHHWFASPETEGTNFHCPKEQDTKHLWDDTIMIRPNDLPVFMPFISVFKLQGREIPTRDIIEDYIMYSSDKYGIWMMPPNPFLYVKHE